MSQKDYTTKLLGVEDAEIEKVEEGEESLVVTFSLLRKTHICPHCGETPAVAISATTVSVPGMRQAILGKYQRCTRRVTMDIIRKLHHRRSMKDIAQDTGASVSAVMRCLALLNVRKPDKLPRALALDEFKGDANGERFQCILTSPETRKILDILPNRTRILPTGKDRYRSFPCHAILYVGDGRREATNPEIPSA